MEKIPLIHPIYLDVPMLVSFAAATQGGLSLETEVTAEKGASKSASADVSGKVGFSKLFQSLFDATVTAEVSGDLATEAHELRKESKAHTESSIAILLYHELTKAGGYILKPKDIKDLADYGPGTLVEVEGTIQKNAVDQVIDYIDAIEILSRMDTTQDQSSSTRGKGKSKPTQLDHQLRNMREALDLDRKRTPISSVIVRCTQPANLNVIVTLRTENLRDLTLSELHKNSVRVVGKITRVIGSEESMSSFENYGMALLKPEMLSELFGEITKLADTDIEFTDIQVTGPAFQVLPLMVFV